MPSNLAPSDFVESTNQQRASDGGDSRWTLEPQLQELVSDGQGDLVRQLLEAFVHEGSQHLDQACKALLDMRMEDLRFHVHSVKGGAGSVGAQRLYETARKVEAAAKLKDERTSSEGVAEMWKLFSDVRDSIQVFLQNWNSQVVAG